MKDVNTLGVGELCDEIRETPAHDGEIGLTHEQLVNAYERLRAVAVELVEWVKPIKPLTKGDVVRCYEDPVTEQAIEGDCILLSKVRDGDDGRELWNVRFASDGIDGPSYSRSVHVRNRYNNSEEDAS